MRLVSKDGGKSFGYVMQQDFDDFIKRNPDVYVKDAESVDTTKRPEGAKKRIETGVAEKTIPEGIKGGSDEYTKKLMSMNFIQRLNQPEKYIQNPDGTRSTHKMASANVDGKEIAFPTIVEKNGKLVKLSVDQAIDHAMKTGEYAEFSKPEEAQQWADGGYKKGTKIAESVLKTGQQPLGYTLDQLERKTVELPQVPLSVITEQNRIQAQRQNLSMPSSERIDIPSPVFNPAEYQQALKEYEDIRYGRYESQVQGDPRKVDILKLRSEEQFKKVQEASNRVARLEGIRDGLYPLAGIVDGDKKPVIDYYLSLGQKEANSKLAGDFAAYSEQMRRTEGKNFIPKQYNKEFSAITEHENLLDAYESFLKSNYSSPDFKTKNEAFQQKIYASEQRLTQERKQTNKVIQKDIQDISLKISGIRAMKASGKSIFGVDLDEQLTALETQRDILSQSIELVRLMEAGDPEGAENLLGTQNLPGKTAEERLSNYFTSLLTANQKYGQKYGTSASNVNPGNAASVASYLGSVVLQSMRSTPQEYEGYLQLNQEAMAIAPMVMLRRTPIRKDDNAAEVYMKTFAQDFFPPAKLKISSAQQISAKTQEALTYASAALESPEQAAALTEIGSPYEHFSTKDWVQMMGTTTAIMADMVLASPASNAYFKYTKLGKFIDKSADTGRIASTDGVKFFDALAGNKYGRGFTKAIFGGAKSGIEYEIAGQIFKSQEDELNFYSGFFGGLISSPISQIVEKSATPALQKQFKRLFGNKSEKAIAMTYNFGSMIGEAAKLGGRGTAELFEEFGNEIGNAYRESDNWAKTLGLLNERFGTTSELFHFAVSSFVMGAGMGAGNTIGQFMTTKSKVLYSKLSPEEKAKFTELISTVSSEMKDVAKEMEADKKAEASGQMGESNTKEVLDEIKAGEDGIVNKKAYDFDDTLYDPKTGKLTELGESVKKRIEAGEDVKIVTARGANDIDQIKTALGISEGSIVATGNESKKAEALAALGIDTKDYYDSDAEKMKALQSGMKDDFIDDKEYSDFIDKGVVSEDRIKAIADKIKNRIPLSERETEIFTDKTSQINDVLAHQAATSPQNDLPEPSDAQKEAGNYKMGHIQIQGLDITVENPKGSERSGDGWKVTMNNHYGYIKRTEGADGDHVDTFVGDNPDSDKVFVVDQMNQDGTFDEHKVMIGFDSAETAEAAYNSNYSEGWTGFGGLQEMTVDEFKTWLKQGGAKTPAQDTRIPAAKFSEGLGEVQPYGLDEDNTVRVVNDNGVVRVTTNEDGDTEIERISPKRTSIKAMGETLQPFIDRAVERGTNLVVFPETATTTGNQPALISALENNGFVQREGGSWIKTPEAKKMPSGLTTESGDIIAIEDGKPVVYDSNGRRYGKVETRKKIAENRSDILDYAEENNLIPENTPYDVFLGNVTPTEADTRDRVNSLIQKKNKYNNWNKKQKASRPGNILLKQIEDAASQLGFSVFTKQGMNVDIKDADGKSVMYRPGLKRKRKKKDPSVALEEAMAKRQSGFYEIEDVEFMNMGEIMRETNDPFDIANYLLKGEVPIGFTGKSEGYEDSKERAIANSIGGIDRESYFDKTDRNTADPEVLRNYTRLSGGDSMDRVAQAASSKITEDVNATNEVVTTEDVANFMEKYPGGVKQYYEQIKKPDYVLFYEEKFEIETGIKATPENLQMFRDAVYGGSSDSTLSQDEEPMPFSRSAKKKKMPLERLRKLVETLSKTGLAVDVVYDQESFDAKWAEVTDGKTPPNGFVVDGVVYLNPSQVEADTAVHEFGHLWQTWAKQNNPVLYAQGMKLIRQSKYYNDVKNDPNYSHLTTDEQIADEALARAIGDAGAKMEDFRWLQKFQRFISNLFRFIGQSLGLSADLFEDAQNMNIEEFAMAVAKGLEGDMSGFLKAENVVEQQVEQDSNFVQMSKDFDAALEAKDTAVKRAEFREKYGKEAYDNMLKITRNFEKIIDKLEQQGKITKKC